MSFTVKHFHVPKQGHTWLVCVCVGGGGGVVGGGLCVCVSGSVYVCVFA